MSWCPVLGSGVELNAALARVLQILQSHLYSGVPRRSMGHGWVMGQLNDVEKERESA